VNAPLSKNQLDATRRALRYTLGTASPARVQHVAESIDQARRTEPNTVEWRVAVEVLIEETGQVVRRLLDAEARVAELETERHSTNEALSEAAEAIRAKDQRIAELEKALVEATGKTYREAARLLENTGRDDDSVSLMDNMADAFQPGGTAAVTQ
jgi:septal ring factor EnvC (AmiA/AmiB activator)